MFTMRCPFCHRHVLRWFYDSHVEGHTRLRADGQMTDHVTLRPDERYDGPLDEFPTSYRHDLCGKSTGMPEEIVRSYLVNPFLYSSETFCCGCGDYVSHSELEWVDTGERLDIYFDRLRRAYLRHYGALPDICAPEFRRRGGRS